MSELPLINWNKPLCVRGYPKSFARQVCSDRKNPFDTEVRYAVLYCIDSSSTDPGSAGQIEEMVFVDKYGRTRSQETYAFIRNAVIEKTGWITIYRTMYTKNLFPSTIICESKAAAIKAQHGKFDASEVVDVVQINWKE